jgi:hypothetical protein
MAARRRGGTGGGKIPFNWPDDKGQFGLRGVKHEDGSVSLQYEDGSRVPPSRRKKLTPAQQALVKKFGRGAF